ncbi:hypothetical protein [Spirosoma spitsbergense]|jgi:hypothetical protein|uniref:hypothetical protein n=1 Tax=Spirosoma spitsbergense TaxID=431554 RepID=UPI00035ECCD9|nr:hypothetical protein [Spirosoma spitsbergense]
MCTLKNLLFVFAVATTITLTSCQSASIEPQAPEKTTQAHPAVAEDDADQPPKDRDNGGH